MQYVALTVHTLDPWDGHTHDPWDGILSVYFSFLKVVMFHITLTGMKHTL